MVASLVCHAAMGAFLSWIFIVYYLNGKSGKWKIFIEALIGLGGNTGCIFILDKMFSLQDTSIRMYSIATCIFSFLVVTCILLFVASHLIKDKNDDDKLRIRDILLGQTDWIDTYYEYRSKQIDEKLNIPALERREKAIKDRELALDKRAENLAREQEKFDALSNKKLKFSLPEKSNIIITKDFIDMMPSYINDVSICIKDIESCTGLFLEKPLNTFDFSMLKTYFGMVLMYISKDIFGGRTSDVRLHFRYYNREKDGYDKLVAVIGEKIITNSMTFIPYHTNVSMIKRSYECRRALIKSINVAHDYRCNNRTIWQDYMTYTFYNLKNRRQAIFVIWDICKKRSAI